MHKLVISNIQRFSLHDGPGIRTTFFFKGCSLRCPWCCNPENINPNIQNCRNGKTYGVEYSLEKLIDVVLKDKAYFVGELSSNDWNISSYSDFTKLPGGITLSGGEALFQGDETLFFLEALNLQNIHCTMETSLYVESRILKEALRYINFLYVDFKYGNAYDSQRILKADYSLFLDNIAMIANTNVPIIARVPIIVGYNDYFENLSSILNMMRNIKNIIKIELLPGHNLGAEKYVELGLSQPSIYPCSRELLFSSYDLFSALGKPVEVLKI